MPLLHTFRIYQFDLHPNTISHTIRILLLGFPIKWLSIKCTSQIDSFHLGWNIKKLPQVQQEFILWKKQIDVLYVSLCVTFARNARCESSFICCEIDKNNIVTMQSIYTLEKNLVWVIHQFNRSVLKFTTLRASRVLALGSCLQFVHESSSLKLETDCEW